VFAYRAYASPTDVATDWGTASEVYAMAVKIFSQARSILTGDGQLLVFPMGASDVLVGAIIAGSSLAFFGGAMFAGYTPSNSEVITAAETMQALGKIFGVPSSLIADLNSGGLFKTISDQKLTYARMFLHTLSAQKARFALAAYHSTAKRAF
jgi:hypothetical protein